MVSGQGTWSPNSSLPQLWARPGQAGNRSGNPKPPEENSDVASGAQRRPAKYQKMIRDGHHSRIPRGGLRTAGPWDPVRRSQIQNGASLGGRSGYCLSSMLLPWPADLPCCFICAGPHERHEYICRVVDCSAKAGTACQHSPASAGTEGDYTPLWPATVPLGEQLENSRVA